MSSIMRLGGVKRRITAAQRAYNNTSDISQYLHVRERERLNTDVLNTPYYEKKKKNTTHHFQNRNQSMYLALESFSFHGGQM